MITKINYLLLFCFLFSSSTLLCQEKVYHLKKGQELVLMGVGAGLSAAGYFLLSNPKDITLDEIDRLRVSDIPSFDQGATRHYSSSAQTTSDIILYSSLLLPAASYFSSRCRTEGGKVAVMAVQTILLTNGLTSIAKGSITRFRPYAYNPTVDDLIKLENTTKKSFFSAHASNSAAFSFFVAKVMTDLHPEMKHKGIVWAAAATIPAAVSYFRFKAGKHFATDVMLGYAVGASIGFLIPQMHLQDDVSMSFLGNRLSVQLQF